MAALLLALAGLCPVAPARAQGTKPLRKVDLVRLLGRGSLKNLAVAALVRRNCVTFRPTERDRAELRLAGADDAVLAAIDQCLRARAAVSRPSAPPPAPAPGPAPAPAPAPAPVRAALRVVASPQIAAPAGTESDVVVQLYRGTAGQAGVALVLRGASAIPDGVTQDPVALTDQRGAATFRVLAGTTPGTYRLSVGLQNGGPLGPGSDIQFVTTAVTAPAAPARAEAPPPPPPPPPPPSPVPSEDLTQFTRGTGQHGAAGAVLAQPLVFEVRDPAGMPLVGEPVTFAATSGAVSPGTAASDSSGSVRVRVTLGERTGPQVITAKVRKLTPTATVYVDPGPARELAVERGGAPVAGTVSLRSRDSVVLRVVARDAYGNRTTLENFAAATSGRAIVLRSAEARDSQGVVTLEPRRTGVGTVELSASGLRARVPVDVALPASGQSPWAIGARAAWLGGNDPWIALPNLTGISGADFSVFGRRALSHGFSVAVGAEVGSLTADRTTGSVSLTLLEGYGRAEVALIPRGPVSPVLSVGGGGYRVKSGDNGRTVYHTNVFWSAGGGLDVTVSPKVAAEVRLERQWMTDTGVGHVATLWPVGAGVRIAF